MARCYSVAGQTWVPQILRLLFWGYNPLPLAYGPDNSKQYKNKMTKANMKGHTNDKTSINTKRNLSLT